MRRRSAARRCWAAVWAVEPGYRFFAHPIKHVEWKIYTANHTSSNPATLANLQGRENGCSWMNMIWGVLYQVNDEPFHGVSFKK